MTTPFTLMALLGGAALLLPVLEATTVGRVTRRSAGYFTTAVLLAALAIVLYPVVSFSAEAAGPTSAVFKSDLLALFFSVAVLLVATFVTITSIEYQKDDPNISIFYSLILFTSLGMTMLAFSVDLLVIFVAWELMGLPTFILVGFRKKDRASSEAAVKFFVLGALSSGILLYAISLLYGVAGSTNLYAIVDAMAHLSPDLMPLGVVAIALLIAGFGLKLSAVPFHMWIPDAYEGAPTTVSTLLAAGTKKAGFVVTIRVFLVSLPLFQMDWTVAFAVLAVLTMTLGNVAALTQRSMTRLLAYSSIAHAGYILMGLAVAPFTSLGIVGALFHVLNHAVMKSVAFIAAALVAYKAVGTHLDSYKGLALRMPFTAIALTIALLALAGVPPLNGFWSKLVIFAAAVEGWPGVWWAPWLALAGILNSAFSLGYYGWIIKRMYLDEPGQTGKVLEPIFFRIALFIGVLIIIATGIYPALIYEFARMAAGSL